MKLKFGLRERFLIAIIVSGLIITIASLTVAGKQSEKHLLDSVKNNMYNVAVSYGEYIDSRGAMTYSQYKDMLGKVSISGFTSSYVYVVDKNGTMLYHPTESKVGNSVSNDAVKKLVADLKSGTVPKPDIIEYVFNDEDKLAGYYITSSKDIVVVTCDYKDVTKITGGLTVTLIWVAVVCLMLCIAGGIAVSIAISRPYGFTVRGADRIAKLDVSKNEKMEEMSKRSDESGNIARSLVGVTAKLNEVIVGLKEESVALKADSEKIKDSAQRIAGASADNSAVTQELSAGMNNIAETTERIKDRVSDVNNEALELDRIARENRDSSLEVIKRAEGLGKQSSEAAERAEKMLADVQNQVKQATERAEAVTKITSLTDTISEIAGQTRLLSLNASIEAARAGEQGRGFAVVADEIGKLAQDSTAAVQNIVQIVGEIRSAVDDMLKTMNVTSDFINELVTKEFGEFTKVGEQYAADAGNFGTTMEGFITSVTEFKKNLDVITQAITEINATLSETNVGVGEIANRSIEMAESTGGIEDMITEIDERAESLLRTINRFKV
ncbi:MAG: methyl-accepting chemotaxis protein [Lachnospiraceae bacterium]|nr:methyl-accepting chemotaxis protein [Lachnospiraceae bacterium]